MYYSLLIIAFSFLFLKQGNKEAMLIAFVPLQANRCNSDEKTVVNPEWK